MEKPNAPRAAVWRREMASLVALAGNGTAQPALTAPQTASRSLLVGFVLAEVEARAREVAPILQCTLSLR